jgi:hypothetical protein
MGVSVPLKLKDSAGLQSFDSDDYDFLAYRAGLQLRQSDSSDIVALTRFHAGGRNVFDVGTLTNTVYDSATGTGGDTSLLSVTSISSNIYRNVGTDGEGSLETYNDSNYANLFYQTDSASQQKLVAFSDSDWNVVNNEIVSRIYKYDYAGSVRLASEVTDFDSANGGWSNILPNFFSDTRTTDSATDSDISYSIFQKIDMTGIGVPSDSAKPFTMKYNPDSAEVRIDGELQFVGRDSDLPKTSGRRFPPTPSTIYPKSTTNRVGFSLTNLQTDSGWVAGSSYLDIGLSAEWNDTIWGRYKNTFSDTTINGEGYTRFSIKGKQKTSYLTAPRVHGVDATGAEYNNSKLSTSSTFHVHKDSVGDTLGDRIGSLPQKWVGIKGRIDLADSARFGSSRATHAATNALMQKHVESDGKWTIQFNFDSDTEFQVYAMGTTSFPSSGNTTKLFPTEDTIESTNLATEVFLRPGVNFLRSRATSSTTAAEQPIPDSATREILQGLSAVSVWNGRIGGEFGPFHKSGGSYQPIGADSADEISLIFKNDFQGFQIADSDKLDETIGTRARNHISSDSDAIGSIKIFSATEGNPTTQGYTGNWITKGTATDTRKSIVDTNYTRTRVSTYTNLRTSEYTTVFSETYDRTRTSNYSVGFIGNYTGEFDRTRSSEYISNYTRNRFSTFTRSFLGNYAGNFEGNFVQNFTGNFEGNFARNFAGNFVGDFLRTSTVSETDPVSAIPSQGFASDDSIWNYKTEAETAIARAQVYGGMSGPSYVNFEIWVDGVQMSVSSGGQGDPESISHGTSSSGTFYSSTGQEFSFSSGDSFKLSNLNSATGPAYIYYRVKLAGTQTASYTGNYTTTSTRTRTSSFTRDSTRTSTTTSTGDSTRTSTRTSLQDVIYQYIGDYTRSFSRNFVGNYSRNFSRTRPASFSRDFTGNYTGDYSRNFEGNYTGNYTGNFTGDYIGTYTGGYIGNYLRNSTISSGSAYGNNPLGPPGQFYWAVDPNAFYDKIQVVWDGQFLGYNTSNYNSITTLYSAGIAYNTLQENQPTYNYNTFMRGSLITTDVSGKKYYRIVKAGTYTGNYAGNYGSANFDGAYIRTSTRSSVLTSLATRSSNFSADYGRTRTSEYLAGENFSRTFTGNYTGDYTGNFSRNFIGNYSRNFTGDYTGEAIGTTNTTIQTYTLYVKVG